MSQLIFYVFVCVLLFDYEQKQVVLSYFNEVWVEVCYDGVDGDCLVQVSLFVVFVELVGIYGEDVVVKFVEGFLGCICNGEFLVMFVR